MVATQDIPIVASVPVTWPGSTIVCLGTGPSLCQSDVDACRGRARVIAIKDAIRLAPWADVLYGAGADSSQWWQRKDNRPLIEGFTGLKFSLDEQAKAVSTVLQFGPMDGLSTDPTKLALGHHSGYQAVNLAVLLGAARVLLLGYDLKPDAQGRDHFFGKHPRGNTPTYSLMAGFDSMVAPLRALGVSVVNCSRDTALTTFPRLSLQEALA